MWDPKLSGNISVLDGTDQNRSSPSSSQLRNDKKGFERSAELDSGFLSGPQTFYSDSAIDIDDEPKLYRTPQQPQQHLSTSNQSQSKLSSGFIDSGLIDDDDDDGVEGIQSHLSDNQNNKASPMIIESSVDVGLSEWFCTLNIKNSSQPLNNLNTNNVDRAREQQLQKRSKVLWEACYKQDDDGDTQLHIAIINGVPTHIIWALIRLAPSPWLLDIKNDAAQSPIHLAVLTGQSNVVRRLLLAGAKPSIRDADGNTPLHLAVMNNDMSSVQALTLPISVKEIQEAYKYTEQIPQCAQLPADLEQRNFYGENCVHIATQRNHINILWHLVRFGADINAREGRAGYTPLHIATEQNNEQLAAFLLKECGKLDIETLNYGQLTAYQLASELNHLKLMTLLENQGCEQLPPPESDSYDSDDSFDSDYDD